MRKRYKDFHKIYQPDRCEPLILAANSGQLQMKALKRDNYPGLDLPDAVLPGVINVGYWDSKISQTWGLDWHRNEGIEFTFLSSGNLFFSTQKKQFDLKPGNFTVTRPWQPHKVGNPNVSIGKLFWLIIDVGVRQPHQKWDWPDWIILSKEDLNRLTKILRQNDIQVWKSDRRMNECFQELEKCLNSCETAIPHSRLNILINDLLYIMLGLFTSGKVELDESLTSNLRTIEIFLNHLQNDFERNWTLEDISEHCGMGITSLSKYFKQLTNMTPINYLIKLRLDAAVKMLSKKELSHISSVCYDCGFSSSQYFATAFKKRFKCTPSDFRAKILLKNSNVG